MEYVTSPFHVGEQSVQSRLGVRESIEPWARRVVRPFLPDQHREFYSQLPFVVAASRDANDRPWATLLAGDTGFIQSPDDRTLRFATQLLPGDALEGSLTAGADLGLLGIDLETRRRNRVNGTVGNVRPHDIEMVVGQTFGNCPQYITHRSWYPVDVDPDSASVSRYRELDADAREWIGTADTFFIASGYREGNAESPIFGMDASHRGGPRGFVTVLNDNRLMFPNYAGNNHYNTIGNLVMDPRVGLLFVDFEKGSLLQLSGTAAVDWCPDDTESQGGALQLVFIDIEEVVRLDNALPLRWSAPKGWIRSLRVTRRYQESDDVTSFEFAARDGGDLPEFKAGQHLPLELRVDGHEQPLKRTYSLSNGPGEGHYRISVKRKPDGIVSRHLHDDVAVGDIVSAYRPNGDFVLDHSTERPVALISAGIGVTPMISMLHELASGDRKRPVYFFHGVRNSSQHPLKAEVQSLSNEHEHIRYVVAYSRPHDHDVEGIHFDQHGYITADLINEVMPDLDAEFFVCGPTGFMADITSTLESLGADTNRIYTETF